MMSNKEFLELLNLYIDQEISPEDRELLEKEISSNESRCAMFNEYVRLQQATEKLFNHFRDNLADSVDLKKYHILSRDSQQRLVLGSLYSAAAVLIACMSIFAATRILSEPVGSTQALTGGSGDVMDRVDVEIMGQGSQRRGASGFLSVARANEIPDGVVYHWTFAENSEFTTGFGAGIERQMFNGSDTRVFQSTTAFESPSPDLVSFQFQR